MNRRNLIVDNAYFAEVGAKITLRAPTYGWIDKLRFLLASRQPPKDERVIITRIINKTTIEVINYAE